jgi:deoxyribodipyrimidine photo-lyase
MVTTALWWVRRDLRLTDNQALTAALAHADRVVPVYLLDEELMPSTGAGEKRRAFLFGGLYRLDKDLQARGSRLIVRRGDPKEELAALLTETGASTIFAEEEYSPYARGRDAGVAKTLPLRLSGGLNVHPPDAVRQANGEPYTVFTPFAKAWRMLSPPPVRDVLAPPTRLSPPPNVDSLLISEEMALPASLLFPPGEGEAQRRLQAFVDMGEGDRPGCLALIFCYDEMRNRLDVDGTSQLSPYLGLGMLSARQAVVSAASATDAAPDAEARYNAERWLDALIWREFATSILYHYPQSARQGFRAELRNVPWEDDRAAFDAWTKGHTGYPLVDAAMRQLVQTGWLHNRARMVAASLLVKDLLVDWRWGEHFFMQHLLDEDLAANNVGWQRAAGTGTGAAPYLNILNPALQGKKHDPEGMFVRRWVPELAHVPAQYIHQPWTMPPDVQRESGCVIGRDYPAPSLDHGWARERAMEFFGEAVEPVQSY